MKKILIAGFTKLNYMPYLNLYLEALLDNNIEVHVLSWNRDGKKDLALNGKYIHHELNLIQKDEVSGYKKIKGFLKFRNKAKNIIKKEDFDLVIIMHTLPAILLFDELIIKYSDNYILDYRDITFEKNYIYRKFIEILVLKSNKTFISSEKFMDFLPESDKIYLTHNITPNEIEKFRDISMQLNKELPIKVAFWGFIRHFELNELLINKIGNDNRFELHYYGREQTTAQKLKNIVTKQNIENVFFHGRYQINKRNELAKNTDIIHNMYNNDYRTKRAMGNKFYDSLLFGKPQICNKGSFMGEMCLKYSVGINLDINDPDFNDKIFKYFMNLEENELKEKQLRLLTIIKNENNIIINEILKFINKGENT